MKIIIRGITVIIGAITIIILEPIFIPLTIIILVWKAGLSGLGSSIILIIAVSIYYKHTKKQTSIIYSRETINELNYAIDNHYKKYKLTKLKWPPSFLNIEGSPQIQISHYNFVFREPIIFFVNTDQKSTIAQQKSFILPEKTIIFMEAEENKLTHFQQFQLFHELIHASPYTTMFSRDAIKRAYITLYSLAIVLTLYLESLDIIISSFICVFASILFLSNIYLALLPKDIHEIVADLIAINVFCLYQSEKYILDANYLKDIMINSNYDMDYFDLISGGLVFYSKEDVVQHIIQNHPLLEKHINEILILCIESRMNATSELIKKLIKYRSIQGKLHKSHIKKIQIAFTIVQTSEEIPQFILNHSKNIFRMIPYELNTINIIMSFILITILFWLTTSSYQLELFNIQYIGVFLMLSGFDLASIRGVDLIKLEQQTDDLMKKLDSLS